MMSGLVSNSSKNTITPSLHVYGAGALRLSSKSRPVTCDHEGCTLFKDNEQTHNQGIFNC